MTRFRRGGWLLASALSALLLASSCASSSGDEPEDCAEDLLRCNGSCVDPLSDTSHCGACGAACAEGESCENGACVAVCPEGSLRCDGLCVDADDPRHCGGCGIACGEEEICVDGTCTLNPETCEAGESVCEGRCVDLQSDLENCGACGESCPEDTLCLAGACLPCATGQEICDGRCVEVLSDANHCGGCDNVCELDQVCTHGVCTCPDGEEDCGGGCVDVRYDAANCGACGASCADLPNSEGQAVCVDGECLLACVAPFEDCDGDWTTGCETNLDSPTNCGGCGIDCKGPKVVEAECVGGFCEIKTCEPHWANCNEDHTDGCETNTLQSPLHCGGCFQPCEGLPNASNTFCQQGLCRFKCEPGFGDCNEDTADGCETDFDANPMHCGACNNACTGGDLCVGGKCVPDYEWATWPVPPDVPTALVEHIEAVDDPITGLTWLKYPPTETMSWEDANDYCENLAVAGHADWRMPSVVEMMTIVDHSRQNPALPPVFPSVTGEFWTTSRYVPASESLDEPPPPQWWRQSAAGTLGYSAADSRVRCVRGGQGAPAVRYEIRGQAVKDLGTGLIWQVEVEEEGMEWQDAVDYCQNLVLEGADSWRMPTVKELLTLVDRRTRVPPIDETAFPNTPAADYWASTAVISSPGDKRFIRFREGQIGSANPTLEKLVRCVAGP